MEAANKSALTDAGVTNSFPKNVQENIDEVASNLSPREYQIEILEAAKKQNTIACLGTGTGKTFIAVMLIKEMAHHVQAPFADGGKRIFFLVPTVPLVEQQTQFIQKHTELRVKGYIGEMNVDIWSKDDWLKEFTSYHILVMTGEICRIILHHHFLPVSQICLLIFDECHQARGNSPYGEIMRHVTSCNVKSKPRIFGLSASLINDKCKPQNLDKEIAALEQLLQSKIVTANDYTDVLKYGNDAQQRVVYYSRDSPSAPYSDILKQMHQLSDELKKQGKVRKARANFQNMVIQKPEQCIAHVLNIFESMGTWCAQEAAKILCHGIQGKMKYTDDEESQMSLSKVNSVLQKFIEVCDSCNVSHFDNVDAIPDKLKQLLAILKSLKKRYDEKKKSDSIEQSESAIFVQNPYVYAQNLKVSKLDSFTTSMCGIIFVEQRVEAYVLCKWLQQLSERNADFNFIKPSFISGQNTARYEVASEFLMSAKRQRSIVNKFRNKEFNLLVSTSVLEEGLDVQKCNFVIRFDFPKNFKSHIQSKGRARAKGSFYVLMIRKEKNPAALTDLNNFHTIEQMLRRISSTYEEEESLSTFELDNLIPPYIPVTPGPMITLSSAVGVVHRYCAKLPCDLTVKLMPRFLVQEVDCDSVKKEYMCTLYLPINCPLHEPIIGQKMQRKNLAKMCAALEACKKLHEIGELDDEHLLPVNNVVDIEARALGIMEEEGENISLSDGIPGTSKRKQYYKKQVANVFSGNLPAADMPCYLHVFVLDLVVPLPACLNRRKRPIVDPADSIEGFGILLTKKLPKICKFPIFTQCGRILVDIKCIEQPFIFNETSISHIAKFHRFLFDDTLWVTKAHMDFLPDASEFACYIVAVTKDDQGKYFPDENIMHRTFEHNYNKEKDLTSEQIPRKKFKIDTFSKAVVTKSYCVDEWKAQKPVFHYISQIDYSLNPSSCLSDNKSQTFKEYYKSKYNVDIIYQEQPLLDVYRCPSLHMSKPIYKSVDQIFQESNKSVSKKKLDREGYREYLVPELCIVHPFSDSLHRKATYIPTILFRLNYLLIANDLREEIAEGSLAGMVGLPDNFEWPIFNLESSDKLLREHLVSRGHVQLERCKFSKDFARDIVKDNDGNICSFEAKIDVTNHPGPNPSLLLQALTTKSADDEFNLERLETIGDSFLKYAISVKLYAKYPMFDEGKLTSLRMKLIRNLNLYQLSKKRQLPHAMVHMPFCCDSQRIDKAITKDKKIFANWLPPCFVIKQEYHSSQIADNDNKCSKNKTQKIMNHPNEEVKKQSYGNTLFFSHQQISDKVIADLAEALIGAYLLSCGYQGALRFMWWLGVNPFMESEDECQKIDFRNWPPEVKSPLRRETSKIQNMKNLLNFEEFEKRIGYKFKQPAYLLQAFTHPSYGIHSNDLTDCYQRLEFLGDAVLDYLVTRFLYELPEEHTPGELTDLRSALVNNAYFASLSIKYGFYKNLRSSSITLGKLIEQYIRLLEDSEEYKQFEEYGYYLEEIECLDVDEVEIPKALGDIFESVAGAIYLDSGLSLDAVWKIYYPMMKSAFDHVRVHVPKSPVRELYELTKSQKLFKDVKKVEDKTYVRVELPDGHEFIGVGPNKKVAKKSAAKKAVLYLKTVPDSCRGTRGSCPVPPKSKI